MKEAVASFVLALASLAALPAHAKVVHKTVEYKQGKTVLEGYLAYDDAATGKRPGVIVVHTIYGITDHERQSADRLAALGYVAFAADIYGKGIRPTDQKTASAEAAKFRQDRTLFRARLTAALDQLTGNKDVDAGKLAAIGYCFGGMGVLELARSGAPVKGVVSFHGEYNTPTPQDAKNIKGKVLALHGAEDPMVPESEVDAFEKEMHDAQVDWELTKYGLAEHGFTVKDSPDRMKGSAYDAEADKRSWKAMKDFFAEIFAN